jgi:hypothetical protein
MMTWNMWDPEVAHERMRIIDYGGPKKYRNRTGAKPQSYKQQALQELAARQLLEGRVEELQREFETARNEIEALATAYDCLRGRDNISDLGLPLSDEIRQAAQK